MTPLRLIILAGLIYIAWLLLRRQLRDKIQAELFQQQQEQEKNETAEDVLVEDPVCRVLIPKRQSVRLRHNGETYYFCSDACCDTFISKKEGAQQ
ncbi:YHS domain-containing protein [Candidatus Electronema sp. PJ]|uniref:YHS domain-containing protein n=1 Tax=Candidatus Electronema sp. PJ TaxID=3401572 RepID=UPI003AA889A9